MNPSTLLHVRSKHFHVNLFEVGVANTKTCMILKSKERITWFYSFMFLLFTNNLVIYQHFTLMSLNKIQWPQEVHSLARNTKKVAAQFKAALDCEIISLNILRSKQSSIIQTLKNNHEESKPWRIIPITSYCNRESWDNSQWAASLPVRLASWNNNNSKMALNCAIFSNLNPLRDSTNCLRATVWPLKPDGGVESMPAAHIYQMSRWSREVDEAADEWVKDGWEKTRWCWKSQLKEKH